MKARAAMDVCPEDGGRSYKKCLGLVCGGTKMSLIDAGIYSMKSGIYGVLR